MLTERESDLRILRGEKPEWVRDYFTACAYANPVIVPNSPILGNGNPDKKIKAIFGVEFNDREKFVDMLDMEFVWMVDGCIPH